MQLSMNGPSKNERPYFDRILLVNDVLTLLQILQELNDLLIEFTQFRRLFVFIDITDFRLTVFDEFLEFDFLQEVYEISNFVKEFL